MERAAVLLINLLFWGVNIAAAQNFSGQRISVEFEGTSIQTALRVIADISGINIALHRSVHGAVTMRLHEVPWDQVLDLILVEKKLYLLKDENVFLILPWDEVSRL